MSSRRALVGLDQVIAVHRRRHRRLVATGLHELEDRHLCGRVLHRDAIGAQQEIRLAGVELLPLRVGEVTEEDLLGVGERTREAFADDVEVARKAVVAVLHELRGGCDGGHGFSSGLRDGWMGCASAEGARDTRALRACGAPTARSSGPGPTGGVGTDRRALVSVLVLGGANLAGQSSCPRGPGAASERPESRPEHRPAAASATAPQGQAPLAPNSPRMAAPARSAFRKSPRCRLSFSPCAFADRILEAEEQRRHPAEHLGERADEGDGAAAADHHRLAVIAGPQGTLRGFEGRTRRFRSTSLRRRGRPRARSRRPRADPREARSKRTRSSASGLDRGPGARRPGPFASAIN